MAGKVGLNPLTKRAWLDCNLSHGLGMVRYGGDLLLLISFRAC